MFVFGNVPRSEEQTKLLSTLFKLLKFKRREYVGPPESEVWYESDFEESLKYVPKTSSLNYTMSVSDARTAEAILERLQADLREVLTRIANNAAAHLF